MRRDILLKWHNAVARVSLLIRGSWSRIHRAVTDIHARKGPAPLVIGAFALVLVVWLLIWASPSDPELEREVEAVFGASYTSSQRRTILPHLHIEMTILTIASASKMEALREHVGSTHRYCPRCLSIIYSLDLDAAQLTEVRSWDRVRIVNADVLLRKAAYDRPFSLVQSAIVHAMQNVDKLVYVSVDYTFTGTLETISAALTTEGYLLVRPPANVDAADLVLADVQGFVRSKAAFRTVATAVVERPCADPQAPCVTGKFIKLPVIPGGLETTQLHKLPLTKVAGEANGIIVHAPASI